MEQNMNVTEMNEVQQKKKPANVLTIVLSVVCAILVVAVAVLSFKVIDNNNANGYMFAFGDLERDAYGNYRVLYDPDMDKDEFYELAGSEDYDIVIFTEAQADIPGVDVFDLKAPLKLIMIEYGSFDEYKEASIDKIGAEDLGEERGNCHYMVGSSMLPNGNGANLAGYSCQMDVDVDKDKVAEGMQEAYTKMQVCSLWQRQISEISGWIDTYYLSVNNSNDN